MKTVPFGREDATGAALNGGDRSVVCHGTVDLMESRTGTVSRVAPSDGVGIV